MRLIPVILAPLLLLAACGSQAAKTIATIQGQKITTSDVEEYETYALAFYAWVRADGAVSAQPHCVAEATAGKCGALNRQVLARLIQERVALDYARAHRIRLSRGDKRAIAARIAPYLGGPHGAHASLRRLGITGSFLRGVIERQVLIGKVEDAVTAAQLARSGPQLRVQRYLVSSGKGTASSLAAARTLAQQGRPVPVGTQVQTDWVSASSLSPSIWNVLQAAEPGQFTGPFVSSQGYLVYRLIDAKTPADPLASRQNFQLRFFHQWLQRAVRNAKPRCFSGNGSGVPCPTAT